MFRNLEAEMARGRISKKDLADAIGLAYNTVLTRFDESPPFSITEAFAIRKKFFPDMAIDYLFEIKQERG